MSLWRESCLIYGIQKISMLTDVRRSPMLNTLSGARSLSLAYLRPSILSSATDWVDKL